MSHDVFICHASEDKEAVARPLAEALRRYSVDVWYDEFSLKVGDSLREAIDRGLASSRFAIVIVSHAFFAKKWATREFSGIVALETGKGRRRILPIWHNVELHDVLAFSPTLADIRAISSSIGVDKIASNLLQVIHPEEQPLPVAKTELERFGLEPPPLSDPWWLDMTKLESDIAEELISRHFMFPPLHLRPQGWREVGENIAWAVLQSNWWSEAESKKICQITHPHVVLDFVRSIPALHEACKSHPEHFAGYVPQLLISQFSGEFAQEFDDLLSISQAESHSGSINHSLKDKDALCDARFAFRHPTLGDHQPERIVEKWLRGLKGSYASDLLPHVDYLFWLLSDDNAWLPRHIHKALLLGSEPNKVVEVRIA